MPRFIALIDFTDRGVAEFHDSAVRADAFREVAKQMNVSVGDVYWALGRHDGVLVFNAPDEETATSAMLALSSQGFVRTHTMPAYNRSEFEQIARRVADAATD